MTASFENNRRLEKIGLLILILLAAALRFYRLNSQDIWGDEAFSIFLSKMSLLAVIAGAADTHPPFYPLFLFLWLRLVGDSAFATRALSALTGILIIPLIFCFAKRVCAPRTRVAWFAAILSAVSPLLIYYSQETRMYELVTLLALASMYFTLGLISPSPLALAHQHGTIQNVRSTVASSRADARPSPARRGWGVGEGEVAYFLSTLLAMYTHYSAFYVWIAENIFVAALWWKNRAAVGGRAIKGWIILQIALIAAYVPWIAVQSQFLSGKASARWDELGWRAIEMIFGKTFIAFSIGLTADFPVAQIVTAVFLFFLLLGVFGMATQRAGAIHESPLPALYFLVPIVIAWLANPALPFFFERYVLVALPGFYVAIALGLDYLARQNARVTFGATAALVAFSLFSLSNYFFDDAYAKGKYGQMMAYVKSHAQPGDALILNNPLQKPLFEYYGPRAVLAFYLPDAAPLEDPRTRQQLEDIARDHTRLWLVMFGNPAEYDPTNYLQRWLGAHAFTSFSRGFVDASLTLYDMPRAPTIQRATRAALENISLVGYDLERAEIAAGQTLQLTLHWQATARTNKSLKVFVHLIGAMNPATQSPVWAQRDDEPVGGSRPTTTWQIGEMIDDRYGLQIAENTPPGDYTIEVGMYDPGTLVRVPVLDDQGNRVAEDRVALSTVRVNVK